MTDQPAPEKGPHPRFTALPTQVPPGDWVETVDAATPHPPIDEGEERDRMLRSTDWP